MKSSILLMLFMSNFIFSLLLSISYFFYYNRSTCILVSKNSFISLSLCSSPISLNFFNLFIMLSYSSKSIVSKSFMSKFSNSSVSNFNRNSCKFSKEMLWSIASNLSKLLITNPFSLNCKCFISLVNRFISNTYNALSCAIAVSFFFVGESRRFRQTIEFKFLGVFVF